MTIDTTIQTLFLVKYSQPQTNPHTSSSFSSYHHHYQVASYHTRNNNTYKHYYKPSHYFWDSSKSCIFGMVDSKGEVLWRGVWDVDSRPCGSQ